MNMKQMVHNDLLPYEKCLTYGPQSLTNRELLAVIIRTGTKKHNCLGIADEILEASKGLGVLGLKFMSINQLMSVSGVGQVKAIQLNCIGELSARITKANIDRSIQFDNASVIADYYMQDMRHLDKEQFVLMMLNTKCGLIHEEVVSIGTVNSTLVSTREIYIEAFKHGAVYLVMVHNHPSGDPTPSREDIAATRKIRAAGELLGISLIDHIIIGDNKYVSFKERNIL